MKDLACGTGLSTYALEVLYDFFGHKFGPAEESVTASSHQSLVEIYCGNSEKVFAFNKEALQLERERAASLAGTEKKPPSEAKLRRQIVERREAELDKQCRQGLVSARDKDYTLLWEFVGWAQTSGGHFIYIYYVGPGQRHAPIDMRRPENWRPVDKNHLALFHRRLGKDVSRFYQYASTDVTTTADARTQLELDMRYVLYKWLNSKRGDESLPLLRLTRHLFNREPNHLVLQQQQQQPEKKRVVKTLAPTWQPPVFFEGIDPYEVKDEALHHVSASEYAALSEWPLPSTTRCEFSDFVDVSRRAVLNEQQPQPPSYYEHDPIALFDALCIACNPEMQARRTVSAVTGDHLQVVQNHNVTRVIDYLTTERSAVEAVQARGEEFVWAAMAVENATRLIPEHLREALK